MCALFWQLTDTAGVTLTNIEISETVFGFVAVVIAFASGCVAVAAVLTPHPLPMAMHYHWRVPEYNVMHVRNCNLAVFILDAIALATGMTAFIVAAVEPQYASWWLLGGCIGIVVAAMMGMSAGGGSSRTLHIAHAYLMFISFAFTMVGVAILFHISRVNEITLSSVVQASAALAFIAMVTGVRSMGGGPGGSFVVGGS